MAASDPEPVRLEDLLDELVAGEGEGGGSTAALTLALSASLVAVTAQRSRAEWPEAGGIVAQAAALRRRAIRLAGENAATWSDALKTLAGEGGDLEEKLAAAAAVPLRIGELALDVAELAALAAERCVGLFRAEAATAAILAEAAARTVELLVEMNLAVTEDDERLWQARVNREATAAAAGRAVSGALGR